MKKITLLLALSICIASIYGQNLPKPSPLCKMEQVVGASTISLEYSRPGVKDRKVFGELVPYNELWRLGANSCTKFTCSDDVKFNDKVLKAGTYALFATPQENGEWTIVFNTDTEQSGTGNYVASKDALSVKAKAMENSFNETLVIEVNNITNNSAVLTIKWDKIRVEVPFTLNTDEIALKNIDAAIKKGENLNDVYYKAAYYYYGSKEDYKMASTYVDKSITIKKDQGNTFLKARIMHKEGKKEQAIKLAEEALVLANAADQKGFADFISGTLDKWKE